MSFIGWLDHSEDEQRQVRELLQLFTEKGTVDDLGTGTIRDAIANRLFPGTSVIQTRARYFLFIPWIHQRAERRRPKTLLEAAERDERKLIDALAAGGDTDGLIGRQAGKDVRTLPSAIYWAGLGTFGIFQQTHLTRQQYARVARQPRRASLREEELAEREVGYWHASIPEPPEDFFQFERCDFAMTADESRWLTERMLATELATGPNLHGVFLRRMISDRTPVPESLWAGTEGADLDPDLRALMHHAQRFAVAQHGPYLIYNIALHEFRADAGREDEDAAATLRRRFEEWSAELEALQVRDWCRDLTSFWDVLEPRARIPGRTRRFIERWCALVAEHDPARLVDHPEARTLVRDREREHKRTQARFENRNRLAAWRGNSGLVRLDFRWQQVRRMLADIGAGLGHAEATADAAH